MPDFVDNTAGYSEVTGTADYLMTTTSTGKHRRLDQALTDGQQVAYYAIGTSNGADAFESGIGTWQTSGTTLIRGTITTSTNGGTISWDAGEKTIYIVANSATLVNTEDERLLALDYGELNPAESLDGEELIAASQDGDGVSLTAQQISGNPVTNMLGLNLDRRRGFSDFSRTKSTYTATTNELYGQEPYLVNHAGTGSTIVAGNAITGYDSVFLVVGTDTNGNAGILRAGSTGAIVFDPAEEFVVTWKVSTALLDGTNNGTIQIGFVNDFPALCSRGMYFEHTGASSNWFACHTNSFNTQRYDTGIAVNSTIQTVFRVHYDPSDLSAKYYIDGVLAWTTTRSIIIGTPLQMAVTVRKSAGASPPAVFASMHSFDVPPNPNAIGLEYFR